MKNKVFKITINLMLALVMLFSVTACGQLTKEKGTVIGSDTVGEINEGTRVEYYGTHEVFATDTENYLVKDGASDYVVVVPQKAGSMLTDGKNDFLILFKQATGVSLSVKTDNAIENFSTSQKYISLGETTLVEQAGIDKSEYSYEKLKNEGIRIITKENTVFLLGGSEFGVNNAVYKFLEIYFNFDHYHISCTEIDKNVTNCMFKNIDVTDVPDIDHFFGADYTFHWGRGTVSPLAALALDTQTAAEEAKYNHHRAGNHVSINDLYMPIHTELDVGSSSATIHNAMECYPKGESPYCNVDGVDLCHAKGPQLCYTGHGNEEVVNYMVEKCAEKIIFSLKNYTPDKYPYKDYITLTMEDTDDICGCDACKKDYAEIKHSGSLIRFSNKLAAKVDEWLEAQKPEDAEFHNAYRENFKILVFGYNVYTDPPVDENGELLAEDLVAHKRLSVFHTSSDGVSAHADVYDSKWPGAVEQVKGWKAVSENSTLWFWHNSGNIACNAYFSDGFTTYSNNFMELMAYGGYEFVYAAHFLNGGSELTAWQNLLVYIQNKLRWDCHRDADFYIRKYMKAMYKDAADVMYELLQSERLYYALLVEDAGENNNWGRDMATEANYPYPVLKGWLDMCDQAIEQIEPLKEIDSTLYTIIHQRIEIETAAHLYKIIRLYGGKNAKPFSNVKLAEYKDRIRSIGVLSPGLRVEGISVKDVI